MNNFWQDSKVEIEDFNSLSEEAKHAIKFNLNLFFKWVNRPIYYTPIPFRYNNLYVKMYFK